MKAELIEIMHQCAQGALQGELTFPGIVEKLTSVGVERYHADYSRHEITYYMPDGDSHVVGSHTSDATAIATWSYSPCDL